MPQCLGRRGALRWDAGLEHRPQLVVREWLDHPLVKLGRLHAEERVRGDLAFLGQPRGEPTHAELASASRGRSGATVQQGRGPGVEVDPGHRLEVVKAAPREVLPHALAVGLERLWALRCARRASCHDNARRSASPTVMPTTRRLTEYLD